MPSTVSHTSPSRRRCVSVDAGPAGLNAVMSIGLTEHAKTKPGENPMVDLRRTTVAARYQRAALCFIDQQVADAKGACPL